MSGTKGSIEFNWSQERLQAGAINLLSLDDFSGQILRTDFAPRLKNLRLRPNGVEFELLGLPNQAYHIQSSIDLQQWIDAGSVVIGEIGSKVFVPIDDEVESKFYRVIESDESK